MIAKEELQQQMQALMQRLQEYKQLRAVETAIKTMRKTGLYGWDNDVNAEWPTAYDLLQMAKHFPIKIQDLKY